MRVSIRDYQSLAAVDLELGPLTVIVGPSSSGKSAVLRAIRLLAFNKRGTEYVRAGTTVAKVMVHLEDDAGPDVMISRGKGVNSYRFSPGIVAGDPDPLQFDKCGEGVPEVIAEYLALDQINFATQFDKPFLLDASGGDIAKLLGELSGSLMLQNAAAEAERRRRADQASAKTADDVAQACREQLVAFKGLAEKLRTIDHAEEQLRNIEAVATRATALGAVKDRWVVAQAAMAQKLPESPPSTTELDARYNRTMELAQRRQSVQKAMEALLVANGAVVQSVPEFSEAEAGLTKLYEELELCQTCPLR